MHGFKQAVFRTWTFENLALLYLCNFHLCFRTDIRCYIEWKNWIIFVTACGNKQCLQSNGKSLSSSYKKRASPWQFWLVNFLSTRVLALGGEQFLYWLGNKNNELLRLSILCTALYSISEKAGDGDCRCAAWQKRNRHPMFDISIQ